MRRVRKNLINKGQMAKRVVPIEEALAAREGNLLGENGLWHGQDRYLAKVEEGDLIIPLNELSPETRQKLEAHIGDLTSKTAGKGGELSVSHLLSDGFGLAEYSDESDLVIVARQAHDVSKYKHLMFDETQTRQTIAFYLSEHPSHQLFIYKENKHIQGVLAARVQQYLLCKGFYVEVTGFFVDPDRRNYSLARNFLQILEVWARTLDAIEIRFSEQAIEKQKTFNMLLKWNGYSTNGEILTKRLI